MPTHSQIHGRHARADHPPTTPTNSSKASWEMSREGVSLLVIQRQHADLAITSVYLRGIDNTEIVDTVHERPAPMVPAQSRLSRVPGA